MRMQVLQRLALLAPLVSGLAGSFAVADEQGNGAQASVYLYPAEAGSGKAWTVSAPQISRILSHHLDIPTDKQDAESPVSIERDAWDWLSAPPIMYKGRQVKSSAKVSEGVRRTMIVLSDMDDVVLEDVMPKQLRQTHTVVESPHVDSFYALVEAFGQRLHDQIALPTANAAQKVFGGFFVSLAEGMEGALESAADWFAGNEGHWQKKVLDQVDTADRATRPFYESIRNLVAYSDAVDANADSTSESLFPYQALRLDGLGEIKRTYGEEGIEFKRAKQMLHDVLDAFVRKMESAKDAGAQTLAIVVVPSSEESGASLVKRGDPLFPFRSTLVRTPFLSTRDFMDDATTGLRQTQSSSYSPLGASTLKKTPPIKDRDLASKCFQSADDLNKASNDCSGHGKAVQTSRGGRKCYRCQCKKETTKNNKVVEWTGQACQRQSIAKPFALLAFTTLVLLLVSYGALYYLLAEGSKELPSVLAGISIPNKSM